MVHCQNCTTRNPLNREFCWKCGAKLLVASGPSAGDINIPVLEEHVLERISTLEYSINMLHKRFDAITGMVERLGASNFIDHAMIETLTDCLQEAGIDLSDLEERWRQRLDSHIHETAAFNRIYDCVQRILEDYKGANRQQFTNWINEAHSLIMTERADESVRFLKLAFEHDPHNSELGLLTAEICFQTHHYGLALKCIGNVLAARPDNFEATFLSGLIRQRKGDLYDAMTHFQKAVGLKRDSLAAHATLGSLLVIIGNRQQALQHFSTALKLKPSASVHYLVGAVYYASGEHKRAIQHLKQATELDPEFDEAFYQLGLLCLEMNWLRKASNYFKQAQNLNPSEKRYRKRVRSFSAGATGPDQLNKLIREELQLLNYASSSGAQKRK